MTHDARALRRSWARLIKRIYRPPGTSIITPMTSSSCFHLVVVMTFDRKYDGVAQMSHERT